MNHKYSYILVLWSFDIYSASRAEMGREIKERIYQARFVEGRRVIDLYLSETDYAAPGDQKITLYTNDMGSDEAYVATALRCYLGILNPELARPLQKSLILTKTHDHLSKNPSGLVFTHSEGPTILVANRVTEKGLPVEADESTVRS